MVRARCEKGEVVVSVSDTGPGIAAGDHARVFEPFRQLDGTTRRQHGGSGLGLAISKRFVEMHGGRMWLESALGADATFHFNLPLETTFPLATGSVTRWVNPYSEYEYRGRTRRYKAPVPVATSRYVLLDESQSLHPQLARYIEGTEVLTTGDLQEAIRELNRSPAQALIVNTPSLSDMPALMTRLRDLPFGTPAVACWLPGPEPARHLGVVKYLVKPISREVLLAALQELGEGVRSILLVDDNWEALQLFSRILRTATRKYHVLLARNGGQALESMRARRPDAVLLDLVMPGIDGFGVLQQKEQEPAIREIPVIVISARDPSGEAIVTDALMATRKGGLTVRDFLACVEAVSRVLAPPTSSPGQELPGKLQG